MRVERAVSRIALIGKIHTEAEREWGINGTSSIGRFDWTHVCAFEKQ